MAKLRKDHVDDFQYGKDFEVDRTLEFCAKNPHWPKFAEKEKLQRMLGAAGMKTRRFVMNKDEMVEVEPRRIRDIFQHVYVPLALHDPHSLKHSTKKEFESQPYQESEIRLLVNQILQLIYDSEKKGNRMLGEPENPQQAEEPSTHMSQYEKQVERRQEQQQKLAKGEEFRD